MKPGNSPKIPSITLGLAAALLAPSVSRADYFQAPFGPLGTWRIYETTSGATLGFKDALADARSRMSPVPAPATGALVPGDLVSITSRGKELFISRSLNRQAGDTWIGLTDRAGVAVGAQESQTFGAAGDANRINGWKFTNGDPYSYMNWNPGEPNDAGGEDAVHFGTGGWNDNKSGFALNDPTAAAGSTDETANVPSLRYIVEYATNSPTPFPNVEIRHGSVFPPGVSLPIPPNTAGNWSIREIRGLTTVGNIFGVLDQALAATSDDGVSVFTDGLSPQLDFADPDPANAATANGGPILTTPPALYFSDTPDANDDNIIVLARTRIKITTAGVYTIQVRSDDGFALRIKGQPWTSVAGAGYIDPVDPNTLLFETGTGDSNTRGVINLAVGEYDVEFVNWEGGSGSYYEVTSATGAKPNAGEAQWLPFGSTETLPEVNTVNAVYLKTPIQVDNANIRDRGSVLPAMRAIINANIEAGTAQSGLRPNLELAEGAVGTAFAPNAFNRYPFNNGNGTAADNFITKVEGKFLVAADANGDGTTGGPVDITFGLFCDDGASMRVIGEDFSAVSDLTGDGVALLAEVDGDKILSADYYTGNTNAFGRIQLTEGQTYSFVCYNYEGGGGSTFNLRWQVGDLLTGFTAAVPLATSDYSGSVDAVNLTEPALVTGASNAWGPPALNAVRKVMNDAIIEVPRTAANSATRDIWLLREGGDGSITGAAFAGSAALMPAGAVDNYATKVRGRIVVDNQNGVPNESLELTFGIFSDDGSELQIVGQDFTGVADNTGDGDAALVDVDGDTVVRADFGTGNTNTFGNITLTEGEYDIVGHHFEGVGGSGYEVWWSFGTLTAFDAATFRPLNTNKGLFKPANKGIELVAAGVSPDGPLEISNFTYNPGTGAYTITFGSGAASNYQVEYTIGFEAAGVPTSAQKWNTVPSKMLVPGQPGSTTVSGNISEILAPTGQLPNNSKAFFRVRRL